METLLAGKGSVSNKQSAGAGNPMKSSSIPLAIRFNAGEESVEEIHQNIPENSVDSIGTSVNSTDAGKSSLSSSPQLNTDDFSWKKDFLQSSFFQRKRSGSVEGSGGTSPNAPLINSLPNSVVDPNAVGAWKLIKGKVSQAMEDIKAKNTPQTSNSMLSLKQQKGESNVDCAPDTPASSDLLIGTPTNSDSLQLNSQKQQRSDDIDDSDFEADSEILDLDISTQVPLSTPVIRRPFASFCSKSLPISNPKPITTKKTPTSIKEENKFFRKRKKDKQVDSCPINVPSTSKQKKDIEIESGVEMLEDMILPQHPDPTMHGKEDIRSDLKSFDQPANLNESFSKPIDDDVSSQTKCNQESRDSSLSWKSAHKNSSSQPLNFPIKQKVQERNITPLKMIRHGISNIYQSQSAIFSVALLSVLLILPINDFLKGVVACLFTMSMCSTVVELYKTVAERSNLLQKLIGIENGRNERVPFKVPDYRNMPICEVPAVEEYKPFKLYAGWMNEINNYDPCNFHVSMTKPIYIRLDGSILRIFNTNARVPKRAIWNEAPIHRKNVLFTRHRYFNLKGCRVEMCPRGLARKRYFSRKYPIQLIIKTKEAMKVDDTKPIIPEEVLYGSSLNLELDQNMSVSNSTVQDNLPISHQSSNENNDDNNSDHQCQDFDFGTAVLHSNLQVLNDSQLPENLFETVPCGEETRLLLFARCDREKEDWYRRFVAASMGLVNEQEIRNPDVITRSDEEINSTFKPSSMLPTTESVEESAGADDANIGLSKNKNKSEADGFEGLIIASSAARNAQDYVKFMSLYQNRRQKKQDDLWKGIDQSFLLGPSADIVWANVLIGRVLYGCLKDQELLEKVQEFLQKKISAIKLPSFMEDIVIAQTYLGDTPPIIHRVSHPLLDERGIWIDADVTYEGLMHMTITTKLNLLRLRRQQQQNQPHENAGGSVYGSSSENKDTYNNENAASTESLIQSEASQGLNITSEDRLNGAVLTPSDPHLGTCTTGNLTSSAIYDSDAETSGASSSDSDCAVIGSTDPTIEQPNQLPSSYNAPGNSRRLLRIVDRITASNLFQSATEISYIQRAMENMSTTITLKVELKGLVARIVVNLPPPPSDRVWIAFRGPPRLWISAKPAVGDHTFDWSIVTNVIENKLCDEVYKYLVYPNMVDIIAPFLGQSTYKE